LNGLFYYLEACLLSPNIRLDPRFPEAFMHTAIQNGTHPFAGTPFHSQ